MIRLFRKPAKPEPILFAVRAPVFTSSTVTGKRTTPSKPFDVRRGDKRWGSTNLEQHLRK